MKILCVFGKHQYGDPSRGLGTEYAAFVPSLKNLGHEMIHFESWDRRFYPDYRELNKHLLATIERESPHVMLAVQLNYEIWTETLLFGSYNLQQFLKPNFRHLISWDDA